jgi:S1-C subfamily serine protease
MNPRSRLFLLIGCALIGIPLVYQAKTLLPQSLAGEWEQKQPAIAPRSSHSSTTKASTATDKLPSMQEIYAQVNPAVVTVYGAGNLGSGMILRPEGLILTNRHVVENTSDVQLKTSTGIVYAGRVIDLNLQHDLALIRIQNSGLKLPTVKLSPDSQPKPGDIVYALGSPHGKSGSISSGTFIQRTAQGSLQASSNLLSPGNSGGPLINVQGEVIGVNKGLLDNNNALATHIKTVQEFLDRRDRLPKPSVMGN